MDMTTDFNGDICCECQRIKPKIKCAHGVILYGKGCKQCECDVDRVTKDIDSPNAEIVGLEEELNRCINAIYSLNKFIEKNTSDIKELRRENKNKEMRIEKLEQMVKAHDEYFNRIHSMNGIKKSCRTESIDVYFDSLLKGINNRLQEMEVDEHTSTLENCCGDRK